MEYTLLQKCVFELIGTMVLVLMGDGVCAACTLNKSKAKDAGWTVISLAWGFAVMCGVFVSQPSGSHLNPAVSLGLALAGSFEWSAVLPYMISQMVGGFLGACLVYLVYMDHFKASADNPDGMLGCFCTMPAIEHKSINTLVEAVATFILVYTILAFSTAENTAAIGMGSLGAFPVTALIMALGMSLGGPTGYAMNPARDLSPRLAHAVLPIAGKRDSGWGYSWVPVVGPCIGCVLAAGLYLLIY